jgi:hypothetical protein
MQFRTEIIPGPSSLRIRYEDPVLLTGSCFTENVGQRLKESLFQTVINPFGVVYNPLSVQRSLEIILGEKKYSSKDLEFYNDHWYSWDHHSSFSGSNQDQVLQNINFQVKQASDFLKKASYVFISFGTAWVYRLKKTGNIVCNCHKVPAREFEREMLTVGLISTAYQSVIKDLLDFNPGLKIIFTVSPVRHWKDGAHGNQLSKSVLHLAINQIIEDHRGLCEYFPSYEILLDDLRDYRFYADDLLHPNKQAIDYIWKKFSERYFDDMTKQYMKEIEGIVKASNHRLVNPGSDSSKQFLQKQFEKIEILKNQLPFLNWKDLLGRFKNLAD